MENPPPSPSAEFGTILLIGTTNNRVKNVFPLDNNTCSFGRYEWCDIRIYRSQVSKLHAKFNFKKSENKEEVQATLTVNSRYGLIVNESYQAVKKEKIELKSVSTIEFAEKKFAWCPPGVVYKTGDIFERTRDSDNSNGSKPEKVLKLVDVSTDYPDRPTIPVTPSDSIQSLPKAKTHQQEEPSSPFGIKSWFSFSRSPIKESASKEESKVATKDDDDNEKGEKTVEEDDDDDVVKLEINNNSSHPNLKAPQTTSKLYKHSDPFGLGPEEEQKARNERRSSMRMTIMPSANIPEYERRTSIISNRDHRRRDSFYQKGGQKLDKLVTHEDNANEVIRREEEHRAAETSDEEIESMLVSPRSNKEIDEPDDTKEEFERDGQSLTPSSPTRTFGSYFERCRDYQIPLESPLKSISQFKAYLIPRVLGQSQKNEVNIFDPKTDSTIKLNDEPETYNDEQQGAITEEKKQRRTSAPLPAAPRTLAPITRRHSLRERVLIRSAVKVLHRSASTGDLAAAARNSGNSNSTPSPPASPSPSNCRAKDKSVDAHLKEQNQIRQKEHEQTVAIFKLDDINLSSNNKSEFCEDNVPSAPETSIVSEAKEQKDPNSTSCDKKKTDLVENDLKAVFVTPSKPSKNVLAPMTENIHRDLPNQPLPFKSERKPMTASQYPYEKRKVRFMTDDNDEDTENIPLEKNNKRMRVNDDENHKSSYVVPVLPITVINTTPDKKSPHRVPRSARTRTGTPRQASRVKTKTPTKAVQEAYWEYMRYKESMENTNTPEQDSPTKPQFSARRVYLGDQTNQSEKLDIMSPSKPSGQSLESILQSPIRKLGQPQQQELDCFTFKLPDTCNFIQETPKTEPALTTKFREGITPPASATFLLRMQIEDARRKSTRAQYKSPTPSKSIDHSLPNFEVTKSDFQKASIFEDTKIFSCSQTTLPAKNINIPEHVDCVQLEAHAKKNDNFFDSPISKQINDFVVAVKDEEHTETPKKSQRSQRRNSNKAKEVIVEVPSSQRRVRSCSISSVVDGESNEQKVNEQAPQNDRTRRPSFTESTVSSRTRTTSKKTLDADNVAKEKSQVLSSANINDDPISDRKTARLPARLTLSRKDKNVDEVAIDEDSNFTAAQSKLPRLKSRSAVPARNTIASSKKPNSKAGTDLNVISSVPADEDRRTTRRKAEATATDNTVSVPSNAGPRRVASAKTVPSSCKTASTRSQSPPAHEKPLDVKESRRVLGTYNRDSATIERSTKQENVDKAAKTAKKKSSSSSLKNKSTPGVTAETTASRVVPVATRRTLRTRK